MKTQRQFRRYIPVLIKSELDKLDYHRRDDLYVILDLIYRKETRFKADYQDLYGFTEISKAAFQELLPSNDGFQEAMQFLLDNQLVIRNDYYVIKGGVSKSYKLPRELLSKTIPVTIQDKKINKRIAEQLKSYKKMKEKSLEFAQSKYFKTFRIDVPAANKAILNKTVSEIKRLCFNLGLTYSEKDILDIIECRNDHAKKRFRIMICPKGKELYNIMHRYMVHLMRLNAINDGFLFFKRNSTNGRLDTNLTSLPSYLRPYIISDEKLISLDIKNSQPYFLYALIRNNPSINPDELKLFGELVISGTLYEEMARRYKEHTGYSRTRNQMKLLMYRIFFSEVKSFPKQKAFFGKMFPSILTFISDTNSVKNNTLALSLQQMESNAVLDVVMPMLEAEGIIPYTIHDSFICLESEAERIREVFTQKLIEMFDIAPAMHMDYILPEVEDEEMAVWDDEFFKEMNGEEVTQDEPAPVKEVPFPRRSAEETKRLLSELMKCQRAG